jgi:hypothetical protein
MRQPEATITVGSGLVDPDFAGRLGRKRTAVGETLWVALEGSAKGQSAVSEPLASETVMNVAGGQQTDAGMMVLFVVPGKEIDAVCAGMLDGTEARWKIGSITSAS